MFFSFIIIVLNIFLRLFGFGFPMYGLNGLEIGSKGFFYAGNEISATLLIVSSFLMYWFKLFNKKDTVFDYWIYNNTNWFIYHLKLQFYVILS